MNETILHALLEAGVRHGASDVHFRPGAPPYYRVNTQLVPLKADPLTPAATETLARLIAGQRMKSGEHTQEVDSSYQLPGVARFRVNIYRQRETYGLVLRIIPTEAPTLAKLNLPQRQVPVRVRIDPAVRDDLDAIGQLRLPSTNGSIALASVL